MSAPDRRVRVGDTVTLEVGLKAALEEAVREDMTAIAQGSGPVRSLSTPSLVALMEKAAMKALEGRLESGTATVGSRVDMTHVAPTPVGARVVACATLVKVEGRRLVFSVSVRDSTGVIGRGVHERVVVRLAAFEQRLAEHGSKAATSEVLIHSPDG